MVCHFIEEETEAQFEASIFKSGHQFRVACPQPPQHQAMCEPGRVTRATVWKPSGQVTCPRAHSAFGARAGNGTQVSGLPHTALITKQCCLFFFLFKERKG